tara:strand:+ start:1294 stop:1482 length:189 start_codon:yes stop_codon:yes gene_type:complete
MAKGDSGRIVLEVDPNLKKTLYSLLALEQKTLKDWFIEQAEQYIADQKGELIKAIEKGKHEI